MATFTKEYLSDVLESTNIKSNAGRTEAINILLDAIAGLDEAETLELRGFGTFERKRQTQHNRCNPRTGDPVDSVSFTTLRFKPSKMLRRS